jgi:hypothetical protein
MLLRDPIVPHGHQPLAPTQRLILVAEILATYLHVRWLMHRQDLPTALARLRTPPPNPHPTNRTPHANELAARRIGYAVGATLRRLPTDGRCLMRSLVLTRMLTRRRLPSSVVIGVTAAPEFSAHAWVEHAGRQLLPAYDAIFTRLVEL